MSAGEAMEIEVTSTSDRSPPVVSTLDPPSTAAPPDDEVEEAEEEEEVFDLVALLESVDDDDDGPSKSDSDKISVLTSILVEPGNRFGPKATSIKERAIYALTRSYCNSSQFDDVVNLLTGAVCRPFFNSATKAKCAKTVRAVLDLVCTLAPKQLDMQKDVCRNIIAWCVGEKRTFLRQRVEAKLASILFAQHDYGPALSLIDNLLTDLKKLDDKQLLVETHLIESKIHHGLRGLAKAKAALTACRTCANAIYVAPALQASIDSMSGVLHCEEGDFNTAHSYFLEAFEQLDQLDDRERAMPCLKYMMLCRILDSLVKALKISAKGGVGAKLNRSEVDISGMISSRQGVKYAGKDIDAMSAIAAAASHRSLKEYKEVTQKYSHEIQDDLLIKHLLTILNEQILESNLIRIIEPYSCVETSRIAQLIEMPLALVEKKLSQMILDGMFSGILDQGKRQLIVKPLSTANAVTANHTPNKSLFSGQKRSYDRCDDQTFERITSTVEYIFPFTDDKFAFCCARCRCPPEVRRMMTEIVNCGNSGNDAIWHRFCCHPTLTNRVNEDWLSPIQSAINNAFDKEIKEKGPAIYQLDSLERKAATADREETAELNRLYGDAAPETQLATDSRYSALCTIYNDAVKLKGNNSRQAVVLDAFCGIGSALVALKRCRIALKKVIHVDLDPVAIHVTRFNHDHTYNEQLLNDGIKHYYYDKIEDISSDLTAFMQRHGPIDIVIGGPPCSDYSGINAYRQGSSGDQGKYLPLFGDLIQRIRHHHKQRSKAVFFLGENVMFTDHNSIKEVENAFGVSSICIDAGTFSPCRRKRFYYTSIPVNTIHHDGVAAERAGAGECLEKGWIMPAEVVRPGNNILKACTFLASAARIDDERMLKVKWTSQGYEGSTFSVGEREKMMGLPAGYAEDAVNELFRCLKTAFITEFEIGANWTSVLHKKYHHFSGNGYRFTGNTNAPPFFEIKMGSPQTTLKRSFFSNDEYSKHLLGNGFSIPVVEHLLDPLSKLFDQQTYDGYTYAYPWPPYNTCT